MANLIKLCFSKGIWIIGFLFLFHYGTAQNPVTIAVFNESTSMPLSSPRVRTFHPGILLGSDIAWHETQRNKTYFSINLSYIFHKNLFKAIAIGFNIGYDYKMQYGGSLKTGIGVGYMHTFSVREKYILKNREYRLKKDMGHSRFTTSFSLGIGQRFNPNNFESTELFLKQQYWLELPYSPGFIPIMSHSNTLLGAKFYD